MFSSCLFVCPCLPLKIQHNTSLSRAVLFWVGRRIAFGVVVLLRRLPLPGCITSLTWTVQPLTLYLSLSPSSALSLSPSSAVVCTRHKSVCRNAFLHVVKMWKSVVPRTATSSTNVPKLPSKDWHADRTRTSLSAVYVNLLLLFSSRLPPITPITPITRFQSDSSWCPFLVQSRSCLFQRRCHLVPLSLFGQLGSAKCASYVCSYFESWIFESCTYCRCMREDS